MAGARPRDRGLDAWEDRPPAPAPSPEEVRERFREPVPRSVEPPGVVGELLEGLQRSSKGGASRSSPTLSSRADGQRSALAVNFRTSEPDVEAVAAASAQIGRELADHGG